jgi:cytochrome c553
LLRSTSAFSVAALALAALAAPGLAAAQAPAQAPVAAPLLPISLEGDAARGAVLAETCKGCHGVPASHNAYPAYHVPKLGGQNADYIEVALQGYRRGTRNHGTMQAQASSLTDQDIADVAAYFASREGDPEAGKSSAGIAEIEAGRRRSSTCQQCHGSEGIAEPKQFPTLAGQHQSYLEQALTQYQNGQRNDVVMPALVAGLDEAAIAELAAYFSSLPWLHNTVPDR